MATIAIRVPAHPVARKLLEQYGEAIAAPSANRSGHISPTDASHVMDEFASHSGRLEMVLDGGSTAVGIESTVIDCSTSEITPLSYVRDLSQVMIYSILQVIYRLIHQIIAVKSLNHRVYWTVIMRLHCRYASMRNRQAQMRRCLLLENHWQKQPSVITLVKNAIWKKQHPAFTRGYAGWSNPDAVPLL